LLRRLSARFYNPLALRIAGRPGSPYAIVIHAGRRSGRTYRTPVVAHAVNQGVVIPLPYGPDVDWCQNVLAAGGCKLVWQGHTLTMVEPRLVSPQEVRGELPTLLWYILTITGTRLYLRLRTAEKLGR
jgi:deazaflavin-dependent oxidoreductase (nitroreductase family)